MVAGGILAAALLLGVAMAWRGTRTAAPSGPTVAYVDDVVAALGDRGVRAHREGGLVVLSTGEPLDPTRGWARYVQADDPPAAIVRLIDDWAAEGRVLLPDELVADVRAAFEAAGHPAHVHPDRPRSLVVGDVHVVLDNLYAECAVLHPAGRTGRIEEFVRQAALVGDLPGSWQEVRDRVRPRVLSVARVEIDLVHRRLEARRHGGDAELGRFVDLGAGLVGDIAVHDRGVIRSVLPMLHRWGVTLEDAAAVALANQAGDGHPLHQPHPGVLVSGFEDYRDANLLLIPEEAMSDLPVAGDLVVFPVAAELVFLVGADDAAGLAWVLDELETVLRTLPRPLHPPPVVREGGRWAPLAVPETHPSAKRLSELRAAWSSRCFAASRDGVQALNEGVFVGASVARKDEHGWARTQVTWPAMAAVLADSDDVVVVGPQLQAVVASAEVVRELAGDTLRPAADLVQGWWRATGPFPADRFADLGRRGRGLGKLDPSQLGGGLAGPRTRG